MALVAIAPCEWHSAPRLGACRMHNLGSCCVSVYLCIHFSVYNETLVTAFLNQKGGVGKSTLATNAAGYLHQIGDRVLLIDADPQATASTWAALRDDPTFPVIQLARDNMAKEVLGHAANYSHVVIDGPPRAESLSRAVIIASDLVIVPIEPSGASDWASEITVRQIREAKQYKENLKSVFLVSRVISGTVIGRTIREHVAAHSMPLLEASVTNRVPFAEALTMGKTIFEWAPQSAAAREFTTVMQEIRRFYEEEPNEAPA